jgi:hemoglobin-like flavoprotein
MTPQQKMLIHNSWRQVVPIADIAAKMFYDRLFEIDPGLRPLFVRTDMATQRTKLVQALATVVGALDQVEDIVPVLEDLGRRHAGYGVKDSHYDTVGAALLWTLEKGLGEAWTPAVNNAWAAAYTLVATVMRNAAASVADEHAA